MFIPKTASDRVADLHLAQRTRTTAIPSSKPIHEGSCLWPWARGRLSALFLMSCLGLLVTQARADDHGDTRSTATNVGLPSATAGAIQFAGDYDYFRFTVPSSQNITANTTGATDTFGDLFDVNGSLLASNDDANGSLNFSIAIQLNAGTYYVRVRHYSSSVNTGSYQLLLSGSVVPPPVTDDHGNTITSATAVNMPSTTSGAIQFAGDYDCFRFSISGVMNVTACSSGITDTVGEMLDSAGAILVSNDDGPDGTRNFSMTRQLNAGTYYVRVRHYSSSANSGAYQLLLSGAAAPPPVTDDHGNTIATATVVNVPSTTSGAIQFAGDYDCFRFTLSGAQNFTATTTGSTDTFGDLLDSSGGVLISNDDANGSTNFLITRQLNAGSYCVRVRHYSSSATSGAYQLVLIATNAGVPVMVVRGNGNVITNGDASPSESDNTDFGIAQYWGDYTERDFVIQNNGNATLLLTGNPAVSVVGPFSPDFSVITQPQATIAPGGVSSFRVRFFPNSAGTITGQRTYHPASLNISSNASTFSCTIQGSPALLYDDRGNTFAVASDLGIVDRFNIGTGIASFPSINYINDADMFRFTVQASSLQVEMHTSGSTDTYGTLYNSAGTVMATDDNSGGGSQFLIRKTLPAGTYYFSVSGKPGSSVTGQYNLWLGRP